MRGQPTTGARRRGWRLGVLVAAVAVLATACVMDLTDEVGADAWGYTDSINDFGVMAGSTGQGEPWRFEPGKVRKPLNDGYGLHPYIRGVNNEKEVLGEVWLRTTDPHSAMIFPIVWGADGNVHDSRTLIPGAMNPTARVWPWDMNDNGVVVGLVEDDDPATPALFAVDLKNDLPIRVPAGNYGSGRAINNRGVIVGSNTRWVPSRDTYVAEDLGDFWPTDINDNGDMVGELGPYGSGVPAYWKAGDTSGPKALPATGLPAGRRSQGLINEDGLIIFSADATIKEPARPARWKRQPDGRYGDPELFPTDGWTSAWVNDLNRKGEAVGDGIRSSDGLRRPIRWDLR